MYEVQKFQDNRNYHAVKNLFLAVQIQEGVQPIPDNYMHKQIALCACNFEILK